MRRRRLTGLWPLAALLYLTRPDGVLLVVPLLVIAHGRAPAADIVRSCPSDASRRSRGRCSRWCTTASRFRIPRMPSSPWASPGGARVQGLLYLLDSLDRDPITLTAIASAAAVAGVQRNTAARALAAGIVLYLVYVVSIGGDFMAGRFVAVPLFGRRADRAVRHAPHALWGGRRGAGGRRTTATHVPLWSNSRFDDAAPKPNGIVDERAVYFRDRSLVLAKGGTFRNPDWPQRAGRPPPRRGRHLRPDGERRNRVRTLHAPARRLRARRSAARAAAGGFNPEWRTGTIAA